MQFFSRKLPREVVSSDMGSLIRPPSWMHEKSPARRKWILTERLHPLEYSSCMVEQAAPYLLYRVFVLVIKDNCTKAYVKVIWGQTERMPLWSNAEKQQQQQKNLTKMSETQFSIHTRAVRDVTHAYKNIGLSLFMILNEALPLSINIFYSSIHPFIHLLIYSCIHFSFVIWVMLDLVPITRAVNNLEPNTELMNTIR